MRDYSGSDGPRLDLGGDLGGKTFSGENPLLEASRPPVGSPARGKRSAGSLTFLALALSGAALLFSLWQSFAGPSPEPGPPPDPKLVLGGTAERVAKLEKDVQELMLAVPNLEKKLAALAGGAGDKGEVAGLAAQVEVLKLKVDRVSRSMGELPAAPRPALASAAAAAAPVKKVTKPIVAPAPAPAPAAPVVAKKKPAPKPKSTLEVIKHKVKRGDTLYGIAVKYRVTIGQLKKWNAMGQSSHITPGQRLLIYK